MVVRLFFGGTNPTVAQNMTARIRVATLLFFRNGVVVFPKRRCRVTIFEEQIP